MVGEKHNNLASSIYSTTFSVAARLVDVKEGGSTTSFWGCHFSSVSFSIAVKLFMLPTIGFYGAIDSTGLDLKKMAELLHERDVHNVAELERLRRFILINCSWQFEAGAVFTTSCISISDDLQVLRVDLTGTRLAMAFELGDGSNTQITMFFQFTPHVALKVFMELLACPTFRDLSLRLPCALNLIGAPAWPVFDGFVLQVFPVLLASRTLSTLDLTLSNLPTHVAGIARCFSENSALRSCTLRFYPCRRGGGHPLLKILGPFMTTVQSEANAGIKELVLDSTEEDCVCVSCEAAIVNLVAGNTTLEKLEVGDYIILSGDVFKLGSGMARAVGCNRTLKEIRYHYPVAEWKELVIPLLPDADGRQANTTLSTLKLSLTDGATSVLDCMTDLAKLVGFNSTLKHVQVYQKCNFKKRMGVELRIPGKLERLLNNELQRNTSLQSLSVGWWKLFRVGNGHEWQMTYEGPCLALECEYVVRVQMQ